MTHAEQLTQLEKLYSVKLTDEQFKFFLLEFNDVSDDVFEAAAKDAARNERLFPTVGVLRRYVELEQERRWRTDKKSQSRFPLSKPNARTEHARSAFDLLHRITDRKVNGPISAAMWEMHQKFPNEGWDEAARAEEAREGRFSGNLSDL